MCKFKHHHNDCEIILPFVVVTGTYLTKRLTLYEANCIINDRMRHKLLLVFGLITQFSNRSHF